MANKYIGLSSLTSPFMHVYKFDGTTFTKLANPSTLPVSSGRNISISPNGTYVAVAMDASPYVHIYKKDASDVLTKLADPATLPTGGAYGISFSPSGDFLAVSHVTSPRLTVYARSGDTFTKLADPASLPATNDNISEVMFSATGRFIALLHTGGSAPTLEWFELSATTLTKLTDPTQPSSDPRGTMWVGDDDHYMVVSSVGTPFIHMYERSGTTLTKLSDPATVLTGSGRVTRRARYRSDDLTKIHCYYAVAAASSNIGEYQLTESTDTFTRNASFPFVDTEPSSNPATLDVSPDMTLLVAGCSATPYVYFYNLANASAPTKYADPSSLPNAAIGKSAIEVAGNTLLATTAGATADFDGAFGVVVVLAAIAGPSVAAFNGLFEISYINAVTTNDAADFNGESAFGALAGLAGPAAADFDGESAFGAWLSTAGPAAADFDGESAFGALAGLAGPAIADFNGTFHPTDFVVESMAWTDASVYSINKIGLVVEAIQLNAAETVDEIYVLVERMSFSDAVTTQANIIRLLSDSIALQDMAELIAAVMLVESIAFTDTATGQRAVIAELIELIQTSDQVTTQLQAINILAVAMAFSDFAGAGFVDESIVDSMAFSDAVATNVAMIESVLESMALADVSTAQLVVTALNEDSVTLLDTPMSQLVAIDLLTDSINFDTVFVIDGIPYHGWVVNTEGELPVSHYPDYPFNSMLKVGNKYLGVGDAGLFALEGNDDDGDPIIESLKTGKLDFGSPYLKNVRDIYMGFTSSGRVVVKVTTSQDGVEKTRWYEMVNGSAGNSQEGRVRLGKGVKSRYWQFEVINPDGDNLELDQMSMDVIKLTRRV